MCENDVPADMVFVDLMIDFSDGGAVSRFYGLQLAAEGKVVRSQNSKVLAGKATATAVVNSTGVKQ